MPSLIFRWSDHINYCTFENKLVLLFSTLPMHMTWYTAISRKVVGKVLATIPKGIVGGFELLTVFQRNLKERHAKAMDICLRVLKESNKSRFDSYSRQEQCIDHIQYFLSGLSRAHFSDNLSWNSCRMKFTVQILFSAFLFICYQVFRSEGYMTQYKDKSKNDVSQDSSEKPFKFRWLKLSEITNQLTK